MRYEMRLHRLLLAMLVVLLVGFVAGVFYLNAQPGAEDREAAVSLIVVLAVAVSFTYMGMAEGMVALYFGVRHRRESAVYLLLGLVSVASGLYLAALHMESLQIVAVVVAPHALLFGLAELRIARGMERHRRERRALVVCGWCELGLGVVLLAGYRMGSHQVAELLGIVAFLTVLQLISLLLFRDVHGSAELKAS